MLTVDKTTLLIRERSKKLSNINVIKSATKTSGAMREYSSDGWKVVLLR